MYLDSISIATNSIAIHSYCKFISFFCFVLFWYNNQTWKYYFSMFLKNLGNGILFVIVFDRLIHDSSRFIHSSIRYRCAHLFLKFYFEHFITARTMSYFLNANLDCLKMVQEYGSKSNVMSAVPHKENGHASESAFK